MIIEPKVRGFLCLNAHPTGCAFSVMRQAEYAAEKAVNVNFANALIIGASTGYGLSSRIALGLGCGVPTLGVFLEREPNEARTASAGWYNTAAFAEIAKARGIYSKSVCGDAFSDDVKRTVAETVKKDFGKLDLLVYSLAAPRRTVRGGTVYSSVIKPIGKTFAEKTVDLKTETLKTVELTPATEEEIFSTVKVMGGEDWNEWIKFLKSEDLLSENFSTVAYSYVGPALTYPVYRDGTIGEAKKHLESTAEKLRARNINARIAVNKAVVTQAGAAIPVVPLYMSLLMRFMKEEGVHEGCIEQICRLFFEEWDKFDKEGRIRLDNFEMRENIQNKISAVWNDINDGNLKTLTDIDGYKTDFMNCFGFDVSGVDYAKDAEHIIDIDGLIKAQ